MITYTQEDIPADCLALVLAIAVEQGCTDIDARSSRVFPRDYDIELKGFTVKGILAVQKIVADHHTQKRARWDADNAGATPLALDEPA